MKNNSLKEFDINFAGLKNGKHEFKFIITPVFFKYFNYNEIDSCNIDVEVHMKKSETMLEFSINSVGFVEVSCDISNELYNQNVNKIINFIVKFGKDYNDEREDLIIIPHNSHKFNIGHQIYETILLSIPLKKIHPDILSGKMKTDNQKYIINYNEKTKKTYDPRWEVLKELITDKKK